MQLVVEVSDEEDSNLAWTMVSGIHLRLLPPYATIKTVFSMVALNHGLQVRSAKYYCMLKKNTNSCCFIFIRSYQA